MKRTLSIAFALCSICLLIGTGTVMAAKAGYTHTCYLMSNAVTWDGKWTSPTEWSDGQHTNITPNSYFVDKWEMISDPFQVNQHILVEILNDTTNDANDLWQICWDCDMSGGTAPGSGDLRVDIIGHTTAKWYSGTGTGWANMTTPSAAQFRWNNSMSASPRSSTPHWILELMIDKAIGPGPQFWARIAVYDANNSAAGVHAWPPSSADVPNDYGDFPYEMAAVPESLNFGVVVVLSSVAVIVGSIYLRKRPKTTILTPMKL